MKAACQSWAVCEGRLESSYIERKLRIRSIQIMTRVAVGECYDRLRTWRQRPLQMFHIAIATITINISSLRQCSIWCACNGIIPSNPRLYPYDVSISTTSVSSPSKKTWKPGQWRSQETVPQLRKPICIPARLSKRATALHIARAAGQDQRQ